MKIDCQIHEDNQCIFICVAQSCTSKSRFLCSECITQQNSNHNHSMVSLTSLHKLDQSAQFKLLSFADHKKNIISNLKMHNVDEKLSKITSFYDKILKQICDIIEARKQYEINECTTTACTTYQILKQSRIEDLSEILNSTLSKGNSDELDKSIKEFFDDYHKNVIQVEKFLNNCIMWEHKFAYVDDQENKCSEVIFKIEQYLNKLSPPEQKEKRGLGLEILNCIKNEEILLHPNIMFIPETQVFTKTDELTRSYLGIIDIPITRSLLKTSFKVKIHKCKWLCVGICERNIQVSRDYMPEFKLLSKKNGLWLCSTNGDSYQSEEEVEQVRDSLVLFTQGDVVVVTPFDYKIEYYVESKPTRVYSQKFTYDDKKVYCPCFTLYSNDEQIEFII